MSAITIQEAGSVITELPKPKGPGARLKAARQAKQLDLDLVAAHLHLSHDMIVSLEADDYENLPARVFVIGYLRNYARHVGLPPEAIVKALNNYLPAEETSAELPKVGSSAGNVFEPVAKAKRSPFSFVSLLLLVSGVALFFAWQEGIITVPEQLKKVSVVESDQVTSSVASSVPLIPMSVTVDSSSEETSLALPDSILPMNQEQDNLLQSDQMSGELSEVAQPVAVDPVVQTVDSTDQKISEKPIEQAVVEAAVIQANTEANALAVVSSVTQQPAPVAEPEIIVSFSEACWVDIRDSAKTFKFMDQAKAGTSKKLSGIPPFKILLGNANGAKMTINGEPFDLQRYTKANVARFSLDPSALE